LPGPRCYCEKFGCIETWLSGPSFARDASRGRTSAFPDARAVIGAMEANQADARASYDRYIDRLGRALATIVNVLDPHVIVLGGGMSNAPGLAERVCAPLAAYAFTDVLAVRVVRALHGDSSGVRGAARLT
jgi:fructokinase